MAIEVVRGRPGSGKTTVAAAVARDLADRGAPVEGILTAEVRDGRRRRGFVVRRIGDDATATLADLDLPGPPRVGRYGVDLAAFERLALPARLCARLLSGHPPATA